MWWGNSYQIYCLLQKHWENIRAQYSGYNMGCDLGVVSSFWCVFNISKLCFQQAQPRLCKLGSGTVFVSSFLTPSLLTSWHMTPYFMMSYFMTSCMMHDAWYMMHETHRGDAPTMQPKWKDTHKRGAQLQCYQLNGHTGGGRTHNITQQTDTQKGNN